MVFGDAEALELIQRKLEGVNRSSMRVLPADRYWRFQVELKLASDHLDDATEGNLAKLRGHAEELLAAAAQSKSG